MKKARILDDIMHSDMAKIEETLKSIDRDAFNNAVETILKAKKIYIIGIRSCAPLAEFLHFYMNLICDNVVLITTNTPSEVFEQMIHINEKDVVIGISFPRYSMSTLKALEFASNQMAKVITLTNSAHSPINLYSSCNMIAKSEMVSVVDSLVAPLSVINALVSALYLKKNDEVLKRLEMLDKVWDDYQVYGSDELNQIEESVVIKENEEI